MTLGGCHYGSASLDAFWWRRGWWSFNIEGSRTSGSDEMSLRPNLYVALFGHRSAPSVMTALAGVVHDPAGHEHNRDKDNQYGDDLHCASLLRGA
jgi:hypothetical protein